MDLSILDQIPFAADIEETSKALRLRSKSQKAELQSLLDHAESIANPKALYKLVLIESKDDHGVTLDGVYFESRVLRVNLENAQRAFLYLATCGKELYDWKMSLDDPLLHFYAETINNMALMSAREALLSYLTKRYQVENSATMNPGSLDHWPIQAQIPLFELLGDTQATIGVELMDSLLMIPNQSVSGILFETETHFASCQLCPMENCPNRRAAYDETLYQRKYALSED
jgi:hypothetical protein